MTVVTIDGPAGSGKSTVAAALAARLGLAHVDTGAYYRAATLAVLRAGVDLHDADAAADVVRCARIERRDGRTLLDGNDVEDDIRGPDVTAAVSVVAAHPPVRALLLLQQRAEIGEVGAVVEGRDAGTVVVPDAELKVWLTASPQERASRRAAQSGKPGAVAAEAVAIERRDSLDANQMVPSGGARVIDTTGRTVPEILDELERLASVADGARA